MDYIPIFKGELEQPYQIVGWQVAPKASAERIAELLNAALKECDRKHKDNYKTSNPAP